MVADKHEVLLRLRAIELLAYWEGRLVTNKLVAWFGISRQQASADIKRYRESHNPDALVHDPSVKGYVPVAGFKPVLTDGLINEYMDLLSGQQLKTDIAIETGMNVVGVQMPDRSVRPEVFREVIGACRSNASLKIIYASMNNPIPHERVISPHTLVYTGFRWHVRAYCHKACSYRDFVLSRIDSIPQKSPEPAPSAADDTDWNERIALTLVANEHLTDVQKNVVEKDYGMRDGGLQISVRKALAHYTLQRYQAAMTEEEVELSRQYPLQLLPSDRTKLAPYLFGG